MSPKLKDISVLFIAFVLLIILILIAFPAFDYRIDKEDPTLKWERIIDSNGLVAPIYRARIYGGWLVKSYQGNIIFIELNHPDNWVLDTKPR